MIAENQLTEIDLKIVDMLKNGYTQETIGWELYMSRTRVWNRINAMCKEFECVNATQLIYKLAKMGVI